MRRNLRQCRGERKRDRRARANGGFISRRAGKKFLKLGTSQQQPTKKKAQMLTFLPFVFFPNCGYISPLPSTLGGPLYLSLLSTSFSPLSLSLSLSLFLQVGFFSSASSEVKLSSFCSKTCMQIIWSWRLDCFHLLTTSVELETVYLVFILAKISLLCIFCVQFLRIPSWVSFHFENPSQSSSQNPIFSSLCFLWSFAWHCCLPFLFLLVRLCDLCIHVKGPRSLAFRCKNLVLWNINLESAGY